MSQHTNITLEPKEHNNMELETKKTQKESTTTTKTPLFNEFLINNKLNISIGIIVIIVIVIWVISLTPTTTIDEVTILINNYEIKTTIENKTVTLTYPNTLIANEIVKLQVIVTDNQGGTYTNNNLKCNWTLMPVDSEENTLTTEACETLYIPSANNPTPMVQVQVESIEQIFKALPPISINFEITTTN